MKPTIQLKPENVFTLVIGITEFKNMQQVSTWENFIKLQQLTGGEICFLLDTSTPNEKSFAEAFREIFPAKAEDRFLIVGGTPAILAAARPGAQP